MRRKQVDSQDALKVERIEMRGEGGWHTYGWGLYANDYTAVIAPFSEACREQFLNDVAGCASASTARESVAALYALATLGINNADRARGRDALDQQYPGAYDRLSRDVDAPSYVQGGAISEREDQARETIRARIEALPPGPRMAFQCDVGDEIRRLKEREAYESMGRPLQEQLDSIGIPRAEAMVTHEEERCRQLGYITTAPSNVSIPSPLPALAAQGRER